MSTVLKEKFPLLLKQPTFSKKKKKKSLFNRTLENWSKKDVCTYDCEKAGRNKVKISWRCNREKKKKNLMNFWHVGLSMIRCLLTAKGYKLNLVFMFFLKY